MKTAAAKINYVILEDGIPYDWDDYGVWGAVLYDIAEDKIIKTTYGHGSDMQYSGQSIGYKEAITEGIVTEEQMKRACLNGFALTITDAIKYHENTHLNIPCIVSKSCRLIKCDCILLSIVAEPVRYGLGAYRNEYNHKAVVFSPSLNRIASISTGHLSFSDEVLADIRANVIEKAVASKSVATLAHIYAYKMSYAACDARNYTNNIERLVLEAVHYGADPDTSTASFPQQEAKDAKEAQRKAEKMPDLIAWAHSVHPEFDDEQANKLAERVWKKKYAR